MGSKKVSTKSTAKGLFNADTAYMKALIYGPSGIGKTTVLGTALGDERFGRILLLDFESGFGSIKSKVTTLYPNEAGESISVAIRSGMDDGDTNGIDLGVDSIIRAKITSWDELGEVYDWLFDNPKMFNTILIDSLSELNYLNLSSVVGKAIKTDPKHDKEIPELRDYLRSSTNMRGLVRGFRDLEAHVVFTALSNLIQDEKTKTYKFKPNLSGKLADEVPGLVDTVGYLDICQNESDEDERFLWLVSSERWLAKVRLEGEFEEQGIWSPSLVDLLNIIQQ